MTLVIDCSITLAWYFDDEATPTADALLGRVTESGATAPAIWPLEVANGLRTAVRRRRISQAYRDSVLAQLADLAVTIDSETAEHAWGPTLALSDRFDLTPYDAAYLELALRRRLPLATLDTALRQAADATGVALLGV